MKVEVGDAHRKRYDGCCMKQRIKIPKATWTSLILRKRFTCWAFFYKTFFMKYDVKVKVPNGTPKTLIHLDGVVNWDGVLKSDGNPDDDHATHFWGWIKIPITQNLVLKCL